MASGKKKEVGSKSPSVSPSDLRAFFEASIGEKESVDVIEALRILENARGFLASSVASEKGNELLNSNEAFNQQLEILERELTKNLLYKISKYLITGGLITLAIVIYTLYSWVYEPYHLTYETRKIVSIMGARQGWEINEDELGYKTPWELELLRHREGEEDE